MIKRLWAKIRRWLVVRDDMMDVFLEEEDEVWRQRAR